MGRATNGKPWREAVPLAACYGRRRLMVERQMLNDDGVRRLAVAVLQQTFSDLWGPSVSERRSAEAFIDREDFDSWCVLAGLDSAAVREQLEQRQRAAA